MFSKKNISSTLRFIAIIIFIFGGIGTYRLYEQTSFLSPDTAIIILLVGGFSVLTVGSIYMALAVIADISVESKKQIDDIKNLVISSRNAQNHIVRVPEAKSVPVVENTKPLTDEEMYSTKDCISVINRLGEKAKKLEYINSLYEKKRISIAEHEEYRQYILKL